MKPHWIALALLVAACGREPSVASKSAAAYREAQAKGVAVGSDGHEHGTATSSPATPADHAAHATMDHSAHGAAGTTAAGTVDHSAHATMDHGASASTDRSAHATMDHGAHTPSRGAATMDHSAHTASRGAATMDHSAHGAHGGVGTAALGRPADAGRGRPAPHSDHAAHRPSSASGAVDHSQHGTAATPAPATDPHAAHAHGAPASSPAGPAASGRPSGTPVDPHAQHRQPAAGAAAAPRATSTSPPSTLRPDAFDAPVPGSVAEANKATQGGGGHEGHAAPAGTVYTCPMHPEVTSDKPGTCPKCGMTLLEKKR